MEGNSEDRAEVTIEELVAKHTEPQKVPKGVITYMQNVPFTTEEMKARSVVTVNTMSMAPEKSGLHSNLLGTVDDTPCGTCKKSGRDCEMHWGIIYLPRPMVRPEAKDKVAILLNSFCTTCPPDADGYLPLHYGDDELDRFINHSGDNRLKVIHENARKMCTGTCNTYLSKEDSIEILMLGKKKVRTEVPILDVIGLLNKMRESDLIKLGVNVFPASRYVMDAIPVPPIQIRPPDAETGKPHPLTVALKQILVEILEPGKKDRDRRNKDDGGPRVKENPTPDMQVIAKAYTAYISEKMETKIKNTNEKYIGLKGIMDGKKGHVREVMNGKRTNHCARSVASPDPSLKITEIGVPEEIAVNLTTTDTIYNVNRELFQAVLGSQAKKHSSLYIQDLISRYRAYEQELKKVHRIRDKRERKAAVKEIKRHNRRLILEYNLFYNSRGEIKRVTRGRKTIFLDTPEKAANFKLRNGDVIHRTIIDGDVVVLNRQPGLHKYSVIAGKARIRPYRTFGLHPSLTAGLNCDYDGRLLILAIIARSIAY